MTHWLRVSQIDDQGRTRDWAFPVDQVAEILYNGPNTTKVRLKEQTTWENVSRSFSSLLADIRFIVDQH